MNKRNLAAVLWFFAGWVGVGSVFAMSAMPAELGIVVGAVVALLIWWDPVKWVWAPPTAQRRIRPINEVAAELDRNAGIPTTEAERVGH